MQGQVVVYTWKRFGLRLRSDGSTGPPERLCNIDHRHQKKTPPGAEADLSPRPVCSSACPPLFLAVRALRTRHEARTLWVSSTVSAVLCERPGPDVAARC